MKRDTLTQLQELAKVARQLQRDECPTYLHYRKCQLPTGHGGSHIWQHGRTVIRWRTQPTITLPQEAIEIREPYTVRRQRAIQQKLEEIKRLRQEDSCITFAEIDRLLKVAPGYSARLARKYGVDTRTGVGCTDCPTKVYAKGLCKRCYNKWLRRRP